ncbi:MAG TPA: MFS transporter [Thermoanaerobaculia bacterium]|jgi:MFS family permease|nr:MFS transporter [Thermoanaerobaculia bacterium]
MTRRRAFLWIWIGQLISVIGSRLSTFAVGIWVLQKTGSTTQYAFIFICMAVPALLLAPFAGALVDRWDRRKVMIAADALAAFTVLGLGMLLYLDALELWQIYVAAGLQAVATGFQIPAYMASIPLLVPKEQLARANGMVQTAFAAAQIVGPALAGVLVSTISLYGVLFVDFVTFVAGIIALLVVDVPRPAAGEHEEKAPALWQEAAEGFRFVRERGGLLGLLTLFGFTNFLFGIVSILITPMVLSFTNAAGLGMQMSIGGCGLLLGGVLMSAWGGPKRRIHGVLASTVFAGLMLAMHGLRADIWFVSAMGFFFFISLPIMNASQDSIWQTKVPAALQGRCFAIQRVLSEAAMPIGFCIAGPLADRVFEPLLRPGGPLADSVGRVIGVGPGRGIALIFIVSGLTMALAGLVGYAMRGLRNVETDLADAPVEPAPAVAA